jgi:hypothetical protein
MSQERNIHTNLPGYFKNHDNSSFKRKICLLTIFIQFSPNDSKWQFKKIFEIKFAYVTNETDKISIENHIYHIFVAVMAWQVTVYCTDKNGTNFFNKLLANLFNIFWIIEVLHN